MRKTESVYRFPNQADEVYREAEEFRQLSSSERFLAIVDLMAAGDAMLASSPHRDAALRQCEAYEEAWQRAYRKLFADHGL